MPAAGIRPLGAGGDRDGLLRIPRVIAADRPVPLLVMLHGARGSAASVMSIVADAAEAHGVIVLAPDSRGATWDVIREDYGEDVAFLDRALERSVPHLPDRPGAHRDCRFFRRRLVCPVARAASTALCSATSSRSRLALRCRRKARTRRRSSSRHGREDPVLPIERCGRRIAVTAARARLRRRLPRVQSAATSSPPTWSRRRFGGFLA